MAKKLARNASGFTANQAPFAKQDTVRGRKVLNFGPRIGEPGIISLDAFTMI
jgi:hypothetical protein